MIPADGLGSQRVPIREGCAPQRVRGVLHSRIEELNLWIVGSEITPFVFWRWRRCSVSRSTRQSPALGSARELGVLVHAVESIFVT